SNWELVHAAHSTSGHSLAVMGPQVGYFTPEVLLEEDLHGPGIDARGAAFPGVNDYVQLGHGRDYAWSATSGEADDTHTFAEVLCQHESHYLYKALCPPTQKREPSNTWTPTTSPTTSPAPTPSAPGGPRPTSRSSARANSTTRASNRHCTPSRCWASGRTRTRSTPNSSSPGTTSPRRCSPRPRTRTRGD